MNERLPAAASGGFSLDDIYHVFFRHKWKILTIWAVGLTAVAAIWKTTPVMYRSDATVFVRFVVDTKGINPANQGDSSAVSTSDPNGEGLVNSELVIITSFDLALDVADLVGPKTILAKNGGGDNRYAAAGVIQSGLIAEPLRKGGTIQIAFRNEDSSIVQPVLEQIVQSYFKMHAAVHTPAQDDFLAAQRDETRNQLADVEQELRTLKKKLDINSLEESKRDYAEHIARLERDRDEAQAQWVEEMAAINQITNVVTVTEPTPETNAPPKPEIPADIKDKYRRVCNQLASAEKDRSAKELTYGPESIFVKSAQENIVKYEKNKALLEAEYPDLAHEPIVENITRAQSSSGPDLTAAMVKIRALEARINLQNQRLANLRTNNAILTDMEGKLVELQRKRDLLDQNDRYFNSRLERDKFDRLLGPGRSNISPVQKPCPPYRDLAKLSKKLLMLAVVAFGAGLGLAFFLEFYLDRSFKRPIEIENKLRVPLFLTIPRSGRNGKIRLLGKSSAKLIGAGNGQQNGVEVIGPSAQPSDPSDLPPWKPGHHLRPFFDALRDRLIMSFEVRNLTHNPKLVALTSCKEGSGVSTVASGLAASLSETGEGNVLLVDMNNVGQGAAHYFRKGKLEVGLDEALELEKRESAMVQDNLYVVAENAGNENLPRVLHKRFSSLLPRLKASDYDYIIFDMPPINQLSPTLKLARFMDMVFMVVEAEKTDREAVQRATTMLEESKVHVGVILNKARNYVPKRLRHEV